ISIDADNKEAPLIWRPPSRITRSGLGLTPQLCRRCAPHPTLLRVFPSRQYPKEYHPLGTYNHGRSSSHHTHLFKQFDQVIKEFLFDDLSVLPVRDGAELDMKRLVRRR